MPLRLRLRNNPFDEVIYAMTHPPLADREYIEQAVLERFGENFGREASGEGVWPPLALSTLADRERHGYGPGPILVRSGRYRRSWQGGAASLSSYAQRMDGFSLRVGSASELAPWHELGTRHMPARSVAMLDDHQLDVLAMTVERVLERLVNAG